METFSALLAICVGNSPVPGEFPAQRPVTRSFVVFFDLRLNKRLSKQSWGWWFETPSRPLWRHRNVRMINERTNFVGFLCCYIADVFCGKIWRIYWTIPPSIFWRRKSWAYFLSIAWIKLRLCSANHRTGYFSNLNFDWLSLLWARERKRALMFH